jgi:NAD(P)-dependent dehydrogenase (short-subunit alcohol dehydrogenase family)
VHTHFKEKSVLVTGAGRGIGKRLAIGFAKLGARIGLMARSKAELDAAHLEIEHGGGNALRLRTDVCDFEQVHTATDRMCVHYGHIDVVICAAGILGPIGPFLDNPPRQWAETMNTNLFGVANTCRAVAPAMAARRSGKIIVLVGPGAETSRPNFSAYCVSKTAVVRLVEVLAEELSESNIQINCLSPGGTYTSITDEILHAGARAGWKETEAASQIRVTGGASPEKQMELAQFLASDDSNHVSGKLIAVTDDWKKLRHGSAGHGMYTLRRVQQKSKEPHWPE